MRDDGRRKSLAFFTSAYSSYSGCRQYRENILEACTRVGPESPVIHKLRAFYNHPGFVSPMIERVREAIAGIPDSDRGRAKVFYTAHSIPISMSAHTTEKIKHAVIVPIGFISDHMEVLFDLDTEARERCESLGIQYLRAGTVGTHPEFIAMIRKLILERTEDAERETLGSLGPRADFCPENCCPPPPARRP